MERSEGVGLENEFLDRDIGIVETKNGRVRPEVNTEITKRVEYLEVAVLVGFNVKGAIGVEGWGFGRVAKDAALGDELVLDVLARKVRRGRAIKDAGVRKWRWGVGRVPLLLRITASSFRIGRLEAWGLLESCIVGGAG